MSDNQPSYFWFASWTRSICWDHSIYRCWGVRVLVITHPHGNILNPHLFKPTIKYPFPSRCVGDDAFQWPLVPPTCDIHQLQRYKPKQLLDDEAVSSVHDINEITININNRTVSYTPSSDDFPSLRSLVRSSRSAQAISPLPWRQSSTETGYMRKFSFFRAW